MEHADEQKIAARKYHKLPRVASLKTLRVLVGVHYRHQPFSACPRLVQQRNLPRVHAAVSKPCPHILVHHTDCMAPLKTLIKTPSCRAFMLPLRRSCSRSTVSTPPGHFLTFEATRKHVRCIGRHGCLASSTRFLPFLHRLLVSRVLNLAPTAYEFSR
jgi:hypothetical protein